MGKFKRDANGRTKKRQERRIKARKEEEEKDKMGKRMVCNQHNEENGQGEVELLNSLVMFVAWISHVRPHNTPPECHGLHYSS